MLPYLPLTQVSSYQNIGQHYYGNWRHSPEFHIHPRNSCFKSSIPTHWTSTIECSPIVNSWDCRYRFEDQRYLVHFWLSSGLWCRQRSKPLLTTTRPWVVRSHIGEKLLALGSSPWELPTIRLVLQGIFNYITGGGSQSPFSLKYKHNMEFRRDVWYSSNWNLLCESYVLFFIFNAKHCVVNTLLDFKHFPVDCISQTL